MAARFHHPFPLEWILFQPPDAEIAVLVSFGEYVTVTASVALAAVLESIDVPGNLDYLHMPRGPPLITETE